MAQGTGTLGSKLYMTGTAMPDTVDTEAEFASWAWTEIGLITNFGEFGRVFSPVSYITVKEGRTRKLKAGFDDGSIQLTVAQDLSDTGQDLLYTAANESTQDHYGFKIQLNDNPGTFGGPTTYYFRGLPMSFRTQMGGLQVIQATSTIEINSDILYVPSSELYTQFISGGTDITAYNLFNGSDAEAVDPVVSANTLVLVSGNDSTGGVAQNGSQAIGVTGYLLSAGPTVFEARVKISAITNVVFFVGLTDQTASLEIPFESSSSADAISTNCSDGVGFLFDTRQATDNIWLTGVNNDVDESQQDVGLAFVADTYKFLRMEINTSGDTIFYVDGVVVGTTMTTACRTSVNLYPTVCVSEPALASRTVTVDYLYLRQDS